MGELIFLKLGGSLITDKQAEHSARQDVLARLGKEIGEALAEDPAIRMILGHGSGSFGHIPAKKYGTRGGVKTREEWQGFVEVWKEARALNQIVTEALLEAGLPIIAFPPSGAVLARDGQVQNWPLEPMQAALEAGLIPLINGDVIFDTERGGTILSTEDLFLFLAYQMKPKRILLAGLEAGVWADFPACTRLVHSIHPHDYTQVITSIGGSAAVDVTGGMSQKVKSMLDLVQLIPGLRVSIFSGLQFGLVKQAIRGELPGTVISM